MRFRIFSEIRLDSVGTIGRRLHPVCFVLDSDSGATSRDDAARVALDMLAQLTGQPIDNITVRAICERENEHESVYNGQRTPARFD